MRAVDTPRVDELASNVLRLSHQPVAVSGARRSVRAELAAAGAPEHALDDVEIVVSELLGNAVRHARPIAGGVLLVGWRFDGGQIEVKVTDGGSGRAVQMREVAAMSDSGRGLRIVERLATTWGVIDHVGGLRTVWASIAVDSAAALRLLPGASADD